jgi:hypothetical protein
MEAGELSNENSSHELEDNSNTTTNRANIAKILIDGQSLSQPGFFQKIKSLRGAQTSSTLKPKNEGDGSSRPPERQSLGFGGSMMAPPSLHISTDKLNKTGNKNSRDSINDAYNSSKNTGRSKYHVTTEIPKKSTVLGLPLLCCTYFAAIYSLVSLNLMLKYHFCN